MIVTVTVAGAQWLAAGTGGGFSRARKAEPLRTVSVEAAASLYPGGTGDLTLTVANDNPYDINLTKVSPNGPATSGAAACDDPGNGVSFTEVSGTWLVPRNGSANVVLPGSVSMAETSPDACQDRLFTIPVALTGAQRIGPIAPQLTLNPASAAYGNQEVGTTSAPQRFTVGNAGNAATTDLAAALSDATHFTITANTCGQLTPGASCTVDVAARPAARGTFSAQLQVSAGGQAQSAALTVKGVQAVVVPESVSFGSLPVGQERVVAVRVRNIGDATSGPFSGMRISTGSTTPAGTFTLLNTTCSGPLPPGGECTADVRFAPSQAGNFAASLYVTAIPGTQPNGNAGTMTGTGT